MESTDANGSSGIGCPTRRKATSLGRRYRRRHGHRTNSEHGSSVQRRDRLLPQHGINHGWENPERNRDLNLVEWEDHRTKWWIVHWHVVLQSVAWNRIEHTGNIPGAVDVTFTQPRIDNVKKVNHDISWSPLINLAFSIIFDHNHGTVVSTKNQSWDF